MGRIKDTDLYAFDGDITGNDYLIGSDGDNNGKTLNYPLQELGDYFTVYISQTVEGIDQDNQPLVKYYISDTPYDYDTVASIVNGGTGFTVTEKQIPFIVVYQKVTRTSLGDVPSLYQYVYVLKDLGKDTYGSGGDVTLVGTDLQLISATLVNESIANGEDGNIQIIDLGDLGSDTVSAGLNSQDPCIVIQSQDDGYIIVNATINGVDLQYLYIGDGDGTYGASCLQSTSSDFILLTSLSSSITHTSQLINDGSDGTDQYVQFRDLHIGNAIINGQAGVVYDEDFDFFVYGRSYLIERVSYIDNYVSDTVTISDSHHTLDRKDIFVVKDYTSSTATITLTGGAGGSVDTIQVGATSIFSGSVAFNTDLSTTATDVVNNINTYCIQNSLPYNAKNSGAVITITDRSGAEINGTTITVSATTITYTTSNFTGGDDDTKSVDVVTGIAAAIPIKPVALYESEAEITVLDVGTGVTDFGSGGSGQTTTYSIYSENAGDPTEFDFGSGTSGTDVANTTNPHQGTYSAFMPDCVGDFPEQLMWESPSQDLPYDIIDGKLSFWIKTRNILSSEFYLKITLQDQDTSSFTEFLMTEADLNALGLGSDIAQWYRIVVDISYFAPYSASTFDRVYFYSNQAPEIKLDLIEYSTGLPVTTGSTPNLEQVTAAGNITPYSMQTPQINSDETQTNWFHLDSNYFSLGDFGDEYGGSWSNYVSIFDPNADGANFFTIYTSLSGNNTNFANSTTRAIYANYNNSSTRYGAVDIESGVVQLKQNLGAITSVLSFEDPTVTGHSYKVPASAQVATTNYLGIGARDASSTVYADSTGIINISTLLSGIDLQSVLTAGKTYSDAGSTTADIFKLSNSASSADFAIRLDKTDTFDYYAFRFTDSTGNVTIDLHPVQSAPPGAYELQLPSGSGVLPVSVNSKTSSPLGAITLLASDISIADAGSLITAVNIETALQEIFTNIKEWSTYSGTRAGGNLDVTFGDYTADGNGTKIRIDDAGSDVEVTADNGLTLKEVGGLSARFRTSNLTGNVTLQAPDHDGTLGLVKVVNADSNTTYNFDLDDANKIVTLNNASPVSAVIPANASVAYPVGTQIDIVNIGAGTVTVSITSDTLNQNVGGLTLAQYDKRTITKVDTTVWVLSY